MTPTAPPAAGLRTPWEELPRTLRDAVADVLGAPVRTAVTQAGGFSPGAAARVTTTDHRRAFVKAVSGETNPDSPALHRTEARNASALPPNAPVPRLLGTYDDGTWVALVFEDVAGRQPHVPWREDEFRRVLDAVEELGRALTPAPFDAPTAAQSLAHAFQGWRQLIDSGDTGGADLDPWIAAHLHELAELSAPWAEFASGDTLAHADLRADNVLLTKDGGVVFVDWPHAVRAAPWFDLLLMLPCVRAQGGPDPEEVFTTHPLGRDADPEGVTATLAALAGFFVQQSRQPPPPGLPTLRAFQHAQGAAALGWLRKRLAPTPA
ncbi:MULTISPECIES: aminoglycoside phosphotransferase family protein [Streptomyces]|uniref:Aminoglycoside phosphotransferase family protein n=1 Tax=Streptomyces mirabilis TaxID=68239 RepID=A0ABU3UXL4_9ACTN|nr:MULTISPECIES: aminoglycoside phosphotransferase family protein [Streptomyces]MCX4607510.1 aminoglycoside phosphotransferase family protein [Streptomyces mirabilis]MCX5347972.1 aminoglycoside phosphotransferase family protein [Streptomyces mirabilis]MDU8998669.1 aminoglycoside phosphotransferase family protein [Streptomyces mirabilis]QDN86608.1 aminoglycoside phosphotransferase family protein [Streptomyces sp. RLB3-6]QDO07420.1 aminoglycoside phosphotransferase family protein [Streptomyces s